MTSDRSEKRPTQHASDEELLERAIPIDALDDQEDEPAAAAPAKPAGEGGQRPAPAASAKHDPAPIEFDNDASEPSTPGRIHEMDKGPSRQQKPWKRQPNVSGQGATHVKTFIAKLRYEAIEHMDAQINEWLDAHPECDVKFVTTAVGPLTGKLKEEALFVNVWI